MRLIPKIIYKVRTKQKVISLTFDDGPHPEFTENILEILAERNVKTTFFVTGENIKKYRSLAKRMIHEGHELGNHSNSHKNLIFKSAKKIREDIELTDNLLRDVGCKGDILFRPPFGRMLLNSLLVLSSLKKKVIMWSVPTKDYKEKNISVIVNRIDKRIKPGAIIVMHDSGIVRNGKPVDRRSTVEAVKLIVDELLQKGYKFKTVSELINY